LSTGPVRPALVCGQSHINELERVGPLDSWVTKIESVQLVVGYMARVSPIRISKFIILYIKKDAMNNTTTYHIVFDRNISHKLLSIK